MKILVVADIHGDRGGASKAAEYARKEGIDSVLILGDFPSHGGFRSFEQSRLDAEAALDAFRGMRVYAIRGNCDLEVVKDLLVERKVSLDGVVEKIGGYSLVGFGGSNPTPFDTPNELSEEEIYSGLKKLMELCNKKTVLAVHTPPKNTLCDLNVGGIHVGSSSLRKIIEEYQPEIVLCSHIHEAGGRRDLVGKTVVANVGRLSEGRIGVLAIGDKAEVELKKI